MMALMWCLCTSMRTTYSIWLRHIFLRADSQRQGAKGGMLKRRRENVAVRRAATEACFKIQPVLFHPLQSDEINPMPGDRAAHSYLADKRRFLNFFHPFTEIKVRFHLPPSSPNSSEPINLRG